MAALTMVGAQRFVSLTKGGSCQVRCSRSAATGPRGAVALAGVPTPQSSGAHAHRPGRVLLALRGARGATPRLQRRRWSWPQQPRTRAQAQAADAGDAEGTDAALEREDLARSSLDLGDGDWDDSDCLTPRALALVKAGRILTPGDCDSVIVDQAPGLNSCGVLVGSCVACMNVSLGLRTGWGQGGSVTAAVVAYAIFQAIKPKLPFSPYEVNIAQTCASACGTMVAAGGLSSAVPALYLLGFERSVLALVGFSLSVAFLGCLYGVPLRTPMIVKGQYRFPEGARRLFTLLGYKRACSPPLTADIPYLRLKEPTQRGAVSRIAGGVWTTTFNTIKALYAAGEESTKKAAVLFRWFLLSAAFTVGKFLAPVLPATVPLPVGATGARFGFMLEVDPMLYSIGMMIGPMTCASLAIGTVVAWGVMAPLVQSMGLAPGAVMAMSGPRGFLLWPGITLLTMGAITQLAIAIADLVQSVTRESLREGAPAAEVDDHPDQVPTAVLQWGLPLAAVGCIASMKLAFGLPIWQTAIALSMSTVLSYVAVRCVGECNINPIGGVAKVAQLVFAMLAPGNTVANVMQATVAAAGASQAGDMATDFKTGFLLKASPWKQFQAQLVGVPFGALVSVLAYKLFERAYDIGSPQCPAPAALAWKGVAELLSKGLSSLPEGTLVACMGFAGMSVALSLLQKVGAGKSWGSYVPSPLALGLGFLIPPSTSCTIALGGFLTLLWSKVEPESYEVTNQEVGSGLLAGSGVAAVVVAVMTLAGVTPLIGGK